MSNERRQTPSNPAGENDRQEPARVIGVPPLKCQCGNMLSGWQSKSGPCRNTRVHFTRVSNFYTSCHICGKWHEYVSGSLIDIPWHEPAPGRSMEDYRIVKGCCNCGTKTDMRCGWCREPQCNTCWREAAKQSGDDHVRCAKCRSELSKKAMRELARSMERVVTCGSLFSGIGGIDLGFERAGWMCKWQVENEPFCIRVLKHHWPHVARFGDVREFTCNRYEHSVDAIVGGFPCQDLSIAGRRGGLAGERSGLFFEFIRIIREMRAATDNLRPAFALVENVPGLFSSDRGRDFAMVLRSFRECGALDIAWRVLDSQYFGVPQRRRRVFIVCDFVSQRAASVLFESEGGGGNPAAVRKAGQDIARCITGSTGGVSGKEQHETFIPSITSRIGKGGFTDPVNDGIISVHSDAQPQQQRPDDGSGITHSLCANGFDASEDGTGRCTPLVPAGNGTLPGLPGSLDVFAACETCREGPDAPRYKAIGNAVVPAVAEWIGRRMREVLRGT